MNLYTERRGAIACYEYSVHNINSKNATKNILLDGGQTKFEGGL